MTKTYAQIVKQIDTLKLQAEKIRRSEVGDVIQRIRAAVSFYNLSAADLGLNLMAKAGAGKVVTPIKRRRRKGAVTKVSGQVKFSNGMGGTWVGIGKRPTWLREALAAGKQLSDFAVK